MSNFFRSLHLLHLLQQFQADCVYKNSLRCLLLIVTVSFISFPFNFIASVISVEEVHFFLAHFMHYTCYSSFRQIVSKKKNLFRCLLLIVTVHFFCFSLNFIVTFVSVEDVHFFHFHLYFALITLQCSATILLLAAWTVILLHRYSVTKCVLPEICSVFMPYMTLYVIYLQTCIRMSLGALNLDQFEPHMLHLVRSEPGNVHRQSIAAPVPLLRNSSSEYCLIIFIIYQLIS